MNNLHYPLFLLGLLVVAGTLHAEPEPGLTLTISFADEEPVTVYIPDGGLATYHSYEYDQKFGIVARTRGPESDEVDVQLVTFTGKRPHYRAEEVLETIRGRLNYDLVVIPVRSLTASIHIERTDALPTGEGPCSVSCGVGEVSGLVVQKSVCGTC